MIASFRKITASASASLAAAFLVLALSFSVPASAQKSPKGNADGDEVFYVETADDRMNAAIAMAQDLLPEWLAVLEDPESGAEDFSFKFPLEGVEHIWVNNVARDGDFLVGYLSNNPHAAGWALGDPVRVPLSQVSDWGFWDAKGKSHGFFTMRVLLDQMSPQEADAVREYYGWTD